MFENLPFALVTVLLLWSDTGQDSLWKKEFIWAV